MERVVIWHPETRGVAVVGEQAVRVHAKRGWQVLDPNAPKPTVLEAAEKLGVSVDPNESRAAIIDQLKVPDPDPDNPEG